MSFELEKLPNYEGIKGPLLFVIMDGVGIFKGEAEGYPGNAFDQANPQTIKSLIANENISVAIKAHGTAVGMPSDADQGNSEVGHNAIGAGRIFEQGASLVAEAISSGRIYDGEAWKAVIDNAKQNNSPVHFIGLMSDGNVHSNIAHVMALVGACDNAGIEEVYIHGLLDGRDVPPLSALRYFGELEDYLWALRRQAIINKQKRRYFIASGGGRMTTTMDRYDADWSMVERGYAAHVLGQGPIFPDCMTAISELRKNSNADDQNLPHWIVASPEDATQPIGKITDGASVILFNFRGDRAIEISKAFIDKEFDKFERKNYPNVCYAGIMEYDGDTHIPPQYLVLPPQIDRTISEYLALQKIPQFAISETQKFGHVTYFWNGNNSSKFDEETEVWQEITSDVIPFDQAPKMKAAEITDALVDALKSNKYKFLRVNFPNGDMVGHTGSLPAAIEAVNAVDQAIKKLVQVIDELGGTIVITADHGNCEQMIAVDKKTGQAVMGSGGIFKPMTSHTLNPVPFVVHGADTARYQINSDATDPGLGNIAATLLNLLGYEAPKTYLKSLITIK